MLKNWLSLTTITVTLAGVFAWSGTASASLITNGGFESNTWTTGNAYRIVNYIDGWGVGSNGIEQRHGEVARLSASEGAQYVELDTHANSSIWQDVTLTAGTYRLSFDYSPRGNDQGPNDSNMDVTFGSLLTLNIKDTDYADNTWATITKDITVDTDQTIRLTFAAAGNSNSYGANLDNVSLTAVPVPAALPLFGTALIGLVFAGRRRSDLKKPA